MKWPARRLAAVLGSLGLLFVLTGCWDATDINDRTPTVAVGFDRTPDGAYEITLGNALGTSSGGSSPSGIAVGITPTARAKTLVEALAAMHRLTSRSTSFEATQVYVIGRALLEHDGGREVLEYLREANDSDPGSLLIGASGTAHALLTHHDPVFQSEGIRLVREFKSTHTVSDGGVAAPLWDTERRMLDGLPFTVSEYQASPQAPVRALGAAVVGPKGRLEILGPPDQDTLSWLMGRNDYAQIDLPDQQIVRVVDLKCRTGWDTARGIATVHLSLTTGGYKLKGFLRDEHEVAQLESETARTVAGRVGALLQRLSAANLDVLDLKETAREAGASFPGMRDTSIEFRVHVTVMPIPERQPAP